MRLLGLLGKAGSGKSTVANYLHATYGAEVFSFATPLKKMAQEMMGFTEAQVFGTQAQKEAIDPRYNFSPRTFMQGLGEAARRHLGGDVWVKAAFAACGLSRTPFCIIDDVRYRNEVIAIKKECGIVVKLVCPDAPLATNPNHSSEAEVDMVSDDLCDYIIVSKRTPGSEDLIDKIYKMTLTPKFRRIARKS